MFVVFIHGPAACGKYTIGKELSAASGLPLFHNHLTVDLAMSLFEFGSQPFVELREKIWLDSFEAAVSAEQSFIFTFHPESTVRETFIPECLRIVESGGGQVLFVDVTCPEAEIEARIGNESRQAFGKLTSLENYRRLRDEGAFVFPAMPPAALSVASDRLSAHESAAAILAVLPLGSERGASGD